MDGDVEAIETLAREDGAERVVNVRDTDGYSPLHRAAYSDQPALVQVRCILLLHDAIAMLFSVCCNWALIHARERMMAGHHYITPAFGRIHLWHRCMCCFLAIHCELSSIL